LGGQARAARELRVCAIAWLARTSEIAQAAIKQARIDDGFLWLSISDAGQADIE
jgi:hypothetical protein